MDIYDKIRPGKSQRHLVKVGRIATVVIVGLGILWIPVMPMISEGGLYLYLQSVQGYLAPPITAVFLLGLFWKRINATGAVWGLATGFILGMSKLTIQVLFGADKIASPAFLAAIGDFNFLFFTGVLFGVSIIIVVVGSLLTAPPPEEKIAGLTYATVSSRDREENRKSWDYWDIILTIVIFSMVTGIYIYFSFWLN